MTIPKRHPDGTEGKTFFVSTAAESHRFLLQTDRMKNLVIEVLYEYRKTGEFLLHEFVIMPNHLHLIVSVPEGSSLSRVMQLIKGRSSYEAKKRFGIPLTIWQRGFSDDYLPNAEKYASFRRYLLENPVKARLVERSEEYPYCSSFPGVVLDPSPFMSRAKAR